MCHVWFWTYTGAFARDVVTYNVAWFSTNQSVQCNSHLLILLYVLSSAAETVIKTDVALMPIRIPTPGLGDDCPQQDGWQKDSLILAI